MQLDGQLDIITHIDFSPINHRSHGMNMLNPTQKKNQQTSLDLTIGQKEVKIDDQFSQQISQRRQLGQLINKKLSDGTLRFEHINSSHQSYIRISVKFDDELIKLCDTIRFQFSGKTLQPIMIKINMGNGIIPSYNEGLGLLIITEIRLNLDNLADLSKESKEESFIPDQLICKSAATLFNGTTKISYPDGAKEMRQEGHITQMHSKLLQRFEPATFDIAEQWFIRTLRQGDLDKLIEETHGKVFLIELLITCGVLTDTPHTDSMFQIQLRGMINSLDEDKSIKFANFIKCRLVMGTKKTQY